MNPKFLSLLLITVLTSVVVNSALADPFPGQEIKFQQLPMVATKIGEETYYGHDELSTAYLQPGTTDPIYQGKFMADDFADRVGAPVVHVRWWGSYLQQATQKLSVKEFLISFEEDVPANPEGGFSHPGAPILSQVVKLGSLSPLSGTFTETLIRGPDPLLGESLYQYNAELMCPFPQEIDKVYWLKIVALVDPERDGLLQWGWHNRDYTIFDPFASKAPPPPPGVLPGEFLDETLPFGPDGTPVWHFQDDAVSGDLPFAKILGPCEVIMEQTNYKAENYVPPFDGPSLIFDNSKDLAFELFAPEPSSMALFALGGVALGIAYRRRRRFN